MEDSKTDKVMLFQGVKTLIFAALSLLMGPVLLSFAFSKPDDKLYIPLLIIGCLICAFAIFLIFKGIKLIMNSMFKNK
ncbi:MAG: DUF6095 family protein [Algibacter sp.]|uniref:DUF6095 family protein n=1 Tax=Algibacter sp. TaxID=1872428 RepID=UPI0026043DEB|nr:DUF6095 family protein [Algibacter sp.]MDG1729590.1 DUF6095 family protein [Algibacter sp.]MDG2178561.1 DUF6095 family protein [Algibacter sp.]